jgi:hypothetical protein
MHRAVPFAKGGPTGANSQQMSISAKTIRWPQEGIVHEKRGG